MKNLFTYLRIAFLSLFTICLIALLFSISKGVETDIFSILNSHDSSLLSTLTKNSASTMNILCEGVDKNKVVDFAKKYNSKKGSRPTLKDTLKVISNHKDGLLSCEARSQIERGETAQIKDAAISQLFGFSPNLFSVKKDPYFLATSYVLNLQSNNTSGWNIEDGLLINTDGTNHFALVSLDKSSLNPLKILHEIHGDNSSQRDVKIWAGGAPFHAAVSEFSAKKEINVLSFFSVAICLILGIILLRSLKFIPFLIVALCISFIIATSLVFIFFEKPHILTLVFGTSLIGLSVDYTYHAFSMARNKNISSVQLALAKPLTCALITTCTCFSPLLFASIGILQQMAVFTIAGLVSMYSCVMLCGHIISIKSAIEEEYTQTDFPFFFKAALILVFIVSSFGILKLKTGNDLSKIYVPVKFLAESERRILQCGHSENSRFTVIKASSVQEALEKEEACNIQGLSSIVPSLKKQKENAKLIEKLYEKESEDFSKSTNIKIQIPDKNNLSFLEPKHLENTLVADLIKRALIKTDKAVYLVSPYSPSTPFSSDIQIVEPRKILTDLFDACSKETFTLLCFSFAILLCFLAISFRKKLFSYLLPSLLASIATAGMLGYLNETINFFHVLCFFIFVGLGLDYTIFHLSNPSRQMKKTVFFSFLTSLTGLGMLAFTSFSVTRSMGITLSIGLFFAYLFSSIPASKGKENFSSSPWYKQKEQSAGKIRLLTMWYIYKFLGKNIMKAVCVPVMLFIYPFARPAKEAIKKYSKILNDFSKEKKYPQTFFSMFKHLLGFALSMADKTDACTLAKNLPEINIPQSDDSKEFLELIDSGKGVMVISSHIGTIEVFPAARGLTKRDPHVHAFKQLGHNAIYTDILSSYMDSSKLTVHPVEDIGVETASIMKDNITNGDIVIMAGDRISATNPNAVLKERFLNCDCLFPKGVFVFAKLMEAPIFFITCVSTSWNAYEIHISKHKGELKPKEILASYVKFLQKEALAHPLQWFHFHDFFKSQLQEK